MESKFKMFVNDNKGFVVFYLFWFILHFIFLAVGRGGDNDFWPFQYGGLESYGFLELAFYLIVPIVIFIIWKLIGKDVKKAMDDSN